MEATEILRHDHALIRKKLSLLESALQVAPEVRFVIREMCFSLQRLLQEHMHREERASHPSSRGNEHVSSHALLRSVNELLLSGMRASMPVVVVRLSHLIEQLEAQMEQQERTVFPALEGEREPRDLDELTSISGAMSVNEILQRYPHTERLFEQLQINRLREGYESVDEVAWRHGLDASQILEQVRQAATSFPGF